ncbi:MAG: hypothetical protein AVDCRST_MAG09-1742 [uncultured Sphingomonas sp.]|uniref:DUF306 domain-containing protein n=2 Tax=uncultured Sphingomonas sp. TaxID=158754 RepID=A0A6J4T4N7_9SPHN|nr:MAG: hypothetical protein AVDCRST_MAG09-1742 [uncultured Sphingomonas sp.]
MLLLVTAGCNGAQDRLTDEQAMQEAAASNEVLAGGSEASAAAVAAAVTEPGETVYKALGTEPGWALTVRANAMLFQGNDGTTRLVEATPPGFAPRSGTYRSGRLAITIAPGPCRDGMSNHAWRDKVSVALPSGQAARGCGGGLLAVDAARPAGAAPDPAEGNWTVTAINGVPTGGGENFVLTLIGGEIQAAFGCNGLQGQAARNGDHLAVTRLLGTQMACGDPADRFEREGKAVLNANPRIEHADGRTRLVGEAGTIDLAPRQEEGPTA